MERKHQHEDIALLAFFGYLVVAVSVESPAASLEKPRQTYCFSQDIKRELPLLDARLPGGKTVCLEWNNVVRRTGKVALITQGLSSEPTFHHGNLHRGGQLLWFNETGDGTVNDFYLSPTGTALIGCGYGRRMVRGQARKPGTHRQMSREMENRCDASASTDLSGPHLIADGRAGWQVRRLGFR